jgi:3-oxoacyl-[acyl-carrier protein] reductase
MSKVAVVTGGAGGIGEAVVGRLAADEFVPVILDKNDEGGKQVLADLLARRQQGTFICLDLTRETEVRESFEKIISEHGRIDVLVNVAGGILHSHKVEDFPLEHWQAMIDANLTSTFLCCRAVISTMKRQKSGAIVSISSDLGFTGGVGRGAYSAAKAGIVGFSKSLALELAPFGVRVNVVAPGRTATKHVLSHYSPEEWDAANEGIPMGRPAEAADIAEGVAFLASDQSRHMTGQTLHINGGRIMR